jgi:DUF1680 family protein
MDGNKFFYTNPLAASSDYPYHLRWEGGRVKYISKSNCCPPNTVRTVAEVSNYMYSLADDGIYVNMYGSNELSTTLEDGSVIKFEQQTNYPWDGNITITIKEAPAKPVAFYLRLPGWCKSSKLMINGFAPKTLDMKKGYRMCSRAWKAGDKIQLELSMPAVLIESNPLVEETRNQVTVKRGPIVYCLESPDLAPGQNVFDVVIPANIKFQPAPMKVDNGTVMSLTGQAKLLQNNNWNNKLYKEVNTTTKPITIKLIPYYAWANRGKSDMTVWMPLMR